MASKKQSPKKLQYLAHFEPNRGGQHILAVDLDEATRKGEAAAKRLGTILCDVTGPDDEDES